MRVKVAYIYKASDYYIDVWMANEGGRPTYWKSTWENALNDILYDPRKPFVVPILKSMWNVEKSGMYTFYIPDNWREGLIDISVGDSKYTLFKKDIAAIKIGHYRKVLYGGNLLPITEVVVSKTRTNKIIYTTR